jgi:hypothetical protein
MAGCTIDVAVDGEEAVRKLGTMKYDLVLMVGLSFYAIFFFGYANIGYRIL